MSAPDWRTDAGWAARLAGDAKRICAVVPSDLVPIHDQIVERARLHAHALLLTGSTARRRRTAISDLDYHLIGRRIEIGDLAEEIDLHVVSPEQLQQRLEQGDDFTQWSLRFGLVVFDDGVARAAMRRITEQALWPDVERKRRQALQSLRTAMAMIATEDLDAALEQARTALTLTARWHLLANARFPLARAELPDQLRRLGQVGLAEGLDATIHGDPSLRELAATVTLSQALVDAAEPATSSIDRAA